MGDMRIARTRQYLRDALFETLLEKPFGDITVREVTERAQVSKNSFYNHYADLSSLAQDCYMQEIVYFRTPRKGLRDYACRHDACTETLDERGRMLALFKANPNFGRVIIENISASLYYAEAREAEEWLLVDHIETEYGSAFCEGYLTAKGCAHFTLCGMFGLVHNWFAGGMRDPIERATKEQIHFALHTMAGVAGRAIHPEYLQALEDWHYAG